MMLHLSRAHMHRFSLLSAFIAAALGTVAFATPAFATIPPTLSLTATGTGDQVQVVVHGDPNASVLLSYTQSGSGPVIASLGTTDGNGSFTDTISSSAYGLTSGTAVTALVGGTNGAKSPTLSWPTVTSASAFTLSQSALVVSAGSSASITAGNMSSGALYVSGNSNPSVANVSIAGSTVNVSGNIAGSTTLTICEVGVSGACPSVSVVVQNAGSGSLSFSQNNVTVVSGQNLPVTIAGGNGTYSIQYNSNPSVIGASLSGSVLTLSTGATTGSASITLCSTDHGACGVVNASAGASSNVSVSFSNTSPTVATNQSATVQVYGPSGVTYYVSSNSQPSSVQANLSGTTLTLTGLAQGSSNITVCASTGSCASLTASITYAATGANIALSQTSLSLGVGASATVTVSGGEQPYALSGGTSSVARTTLAGSSLTVYGLAGGTSSVSVCSAGGGCVPLSVTVSGTGANAALSLSNSSLTLLPGQSASVALSGTGSYYLSSSPAGSVATAAIQGSNVSVSGVAAGTTSTTVCEYGGGCTALAITVSSPPSGSASGTGVSTPGAVAPATFTEYLAPGTQGAEVIALQKLLIARGYQIPSGATGYYGAQTANAVTAFQRANGIEQLGVVGPATRTALNALESGAGTGVSGSSSSDISSMTLAQLKAQVQALESELAQVLARITQLGG